MKWYDRLNIRGPVLGLEIEMKSEPDKHLTLGGKRPYQKPHIEDYGTVIELTGAGSGTIDDGSGPFIRSGAAG